MYSVPPGLIRFALIRSFSYSFVATAFADVKKKIYFFTFKHFVSLLFYIRLIAWNWCIFIHFVNKSPVFIAENLSL